MSLADAIFERCEKRKLFSPVSLMRFYGEDGKCMPSPYELRESYKRLKDQSIVGRYLIPSENQRDLEKCIKRCDKLFAELSA